MNDECNSNKAIRDGKYLAPPHVSAWQRSPPIFERNCQSSLRYAIQLLHVKRRTRHNDVK